MNTPFTVLAEIIQRKLRNGFFSSFVERFHRERRRARAMKANLPDVVTFVSVEPFPSLFGCLGLTTKAGNN